jgi:hypothetical protein
MLTRQSNHGHLRKTTSPLYKMPKQNQDKRKAEDTDTKRYKPISLDIEV